MSLRHRAVSLGAALLCLCSALPGNADGADSPDPSSVEQDKTLSWDELRQLIPDIEEMEIRVPQGDQAAQKREVRFCEKRPELGTRLAIERCYTLDQLIRKYCRRTNRGGISYWCFELADKR
ncbi:MAG: hypothetical protein AAGA68_19785 [Pseudomonadota bacterium]